MGLTFQDAVDHPIAGASWSNLKKNPGTISIELLNHPRIIDSIKCLGKNHISSMIGGERIFSPQRTTVKINFRRKGDGENVELAVSICNRLCHLTVDGCHTLQRDKMATKVFDQLFNLLPPSTNHRFSVGINDQQINLLLLLQIFSDWFRWKIDHPQNPINLLIRF